MLIWLEAFIHGLSVYGTFVASYNNNKLTVYKLRSSA